MAGGAASSASREDRLQDPHRYNAIGLEGRTKIAPAPYRHANQLPFQIETRIVFSSKREAELERAARSGSSW